MELDLYYNSIDATHKALLAHYSLEHNWTNTKQEITDEELEELASYIPTCIDPKFFYAVGAPMFYLYGVNYGFNGDQGEVFVYEDNLANKVAMNIGSFVGAEKLFYDEETDSYKREPITIEYLSEKYPDYFN